MKSFSPTASLIIAFCLPSPAVIADEIAPQLSANPFDRPVWMDEKAAPSINTRDPVGEQKIVLRATLVAGNSGLAAVGEKIIAIGQEIYGYTLLSVSNGSAVFSDGEKRLHVKVAGDQKDIDNEID